MDQGLMDLFEEDAAKMPNENELGELNTLIKKQLDLEAQIEKLNDELAKASFELRKVSETEIPDIFLKLNLQDFRLASGEKVTVKPYYSASISTEKAKDAFAWLRDHDYGDIIKHEVKAQFGKGEDEACQELKKVLDQLHLNYIDHEGVHPQTLKAFVKERVETMSEAEEKFPMELFNVYLGKKTKIELPKQRRKV